VRRGDGTDGAKHPVAARGSSALAGQIGVDVPAVAAAEHAGTSAGDLTRVPGLSAAAKIFLVGVGDGSPRELRAAAAALARSVRRVDRIVTSLGAGGGNEAAQAAAEGVLLGAYRVGREGTKAGEDAPGARVVQLVGADDGAVRRGVIEAGATLLARELANTRSSTKGPSWLAARARRLARTRDLRERVWTEADLRRDGFGGLLAVGGGAARGPRLVQLDYLPTGGPAGKRAHVVLVGKGITFDTGGISLKPREAMVGMTTDMTGAAVVLAVLASCRDLGVRARVTGLLPLAENAIGAGSYRPGDVVRMYDGTTVEVRNTDAEGRLVLGDALLRATEKKPDVILDVATLTGHMVVALGDRVAGVMGSDEVVEQVLAAARAAGELHWPMPIPEQMDERIHGSKIADLLQHDWVRWGGGLMAAAFLREFTGGLPWAHLDIAGPGFNSGGPWGHVTSGGTGFAVATLVDYARTMADAD